VRSGVPGLASWVTAGVVAQRNQKEIRCRHSRKEKRNAREYDIRKGGGGSSAPGDIRADED